MYFLAEELKAHWEKLERERRHNEALTSKLADMDSAAVRRETDISELKRLLQLVKEENQQVMQVNDSSLVIIIAVIIILKCATGTKWNVDQQQPYNGPAILFIGLCVCVCVGVGGSFEAERESRSTCHYFTDKLITTYKLMLCVAEKEVKEK